MPQLGSANADISKSKLIGIFSNAETKVEFNYLDAAGARQHFLVRGAMDGNWVDFNYLEPDRVKPQVGAYGDTTLLFNNINIADFTIRLSVASETNKEFFDAYRSRLLTFKFTYITGEGFTIPVSNGANRLSPVRLILDLNNVVVRTRPDIPTMTDGTTLPEVMWTFIVMDAVAGIRWEYIENNAPVADSVA